MINAKQTLKNLHKKFPMMSLDELFEVLDCYVEESFFTPVGNKPSWEPLTSPSKVWYDDRITSITADKPQTIARFDSKCGDAQPN